MPVRAARREELNSQGYRVCSDWAEATGCGARLAVIATETGRHVADALDALAAGCEVLIEKPVSASAAGLAELERLATTAGRKIFVACNLRFDSGLRQFRSRLPQIGCVRSVRIECQSYLPDWRPERDYRQAYCADPEQGGALRDLVHEIDYAIWLYGRPERVLAVLSNTGALGIGAAEAADLLWHAPSGAVISLRLDYLTRKPRRRMTAYGDQGEITCDFLDKTVRLECAGAPSEMLQHEQERDQMMAEQAAEFLRTCSGNSSSELVTFEQGAFAVALCDAARRSSNSGRFEPIDDWSNG